MPFRLFQYALPAAPDLADLNTFLLSHRIATVQREIVTTSAGPILLFIVEFLPPSRSAGAIEKPIESPAATRVDYRDLLSEREFSVFTSLREIRKRLAEADGVPVYAVFTNAQLAGMVQGKCTTIADMLRIENVGKARADKYGAEFLPILVTTFPESSEERAV